MSFPNCIVLIPELHTRYPAEKIAKCANMILATKSHERSEDNDTNYLTDTDLAILGKGSYDYQKYTEQIREEYSIYPDFMYNNGRKKTLVLAALKTILSKKYKYLKWVENK